MGIRRYGEPVRADMRYRQRPGAYAVLIRDREVLLTFQEEPAPEFQLPGGGIDPGESPARALRREVFEETGWRIAPPRRPMDVPLFGPNRALHEVGCPFCKSSETSLTSEFGSTACKSLHYCNACQQPFEHFKCI